MTNLSEELCEICGIEPKLPCKRCGASKFALGQCAEVKCKAVYPDFEKPENFVKLMELKVEGLSGGNLPLIGLLNKEYWLSDRQDYIRFLYQYYIPDLSPYWQDKLKQAIREKEWKYD